MFWKNKQRQEGTPKLPGPKDLPELIGSYLVVEEKHDPDRVWHLKCTLRPVGKNEYYCRVFDELTALQAGVKVTDWSSLDAIYREYSDSRTGMQVRDERFWESWPRRGTFPYGFSANLDALGMLAHRDGRAVAYLAAQTQADQANLTVGEFAHLNDDAPALLPMLRSAAESWRATGGRRVIIQTGGQAPVLQLLEAQSVPHELAVGQGVMVLVTGRNWLKPAGFRDEQDAIRNLFFAEVPVMWHRDGY